MFISQATFDVDMLDYDEDGEQGVIASAQFKGIDNVGYVFISCKESERNEIVAKLRAAPPRR